MLSCPFVSMKALKVVAHETGSSLPMNRGVCVRYPGMRGCLVYYFRRQHVAKKITIINIINLCLIGNVSKHGYFLFQSNQRK